MKIPEPAQTLKISELLKENLVIRDLRAGEREGALEEMIRPLSGYDKKLSEKELYEKLLQRERLGSTAVGEGYAIPHCKVKSLDEPLVLLAVSRKGVSFDAIDGRLAHVFFLVVSSVEKPSQNLQILAAVARLIRRSPLLLKKISKARSSQEILGSIREEEEKIF